MTVSVFRSHGLGDTLTSGPGERDEMVVVANKARFGGGEGQEPREAKFCSLQRFVLCAFV